MTARDAAKVLAKGLNLVEPSVSRHYVTGLLAALAAAAADGPLTAEVECPRCWGKPAAEVMPCAVCGDTGTVRVVVHLADPTLVGSSPTPGAVTTVRAKE